MATSTWGTWIEAQLKIRNWRQVDLVRAGRGKVSSGQLSRWLDGTNTSPTLESVRAVCLAFEVSAVEGLLAAGYVTPEEVKAKVVQAPPRGADALSDDELLAELGRRFRRLRGIAVQAAGSDSYTLEWDEEDLRDEGNGTGRAIDTNQ